MPFRGLSTSIIAQRIRYSEQSLTKGRISGFSTYKTEIIQSTSHSGQYDRVWQIRQAITTGLYVGLLASHRFIKRHCHYAHSLLYRSVFQGVLFD